MISLEKLFQFSPDFAYYYYHKKKQTNNNNAMMMMITSFSSPSALSARRHSSSSSGCSSSSSSSSPPFFQQKFVSKSNERKNRRRRLTRKTNATPRAFQLGSVDQDELNAPKIDISLTRIKKGTKIGEGSFGSVFLGTLKDEKNPSVETRVVLKSLNKKMGRDVEAFYQDELNVLNRLKNNDGCAPFLGVAGANVYLVFGYQGSTTLEMCLQKGGFGEVKRAMREPGMSDAEILKLGAKTLLESVGKVNSASIIHRDVKPANILIAEESYGKSSAKRFVMIDAGAACDLKIGKKRILESGAIFDPTYGAPEQFETTGSGYGFGGMTKNLLGVNFGAKISSTGEVPTEKFDSYSCGMTLLRFAVPQLWSESSMSSMRNSLITAYGNDLKRWRDEGAPVKGALFTQTSCDFSVLDEADMWTVVCDLCENDPRKRINVKTAAKRIK